MYTRQISASLELENKQAQLDALQSQINRILFNTLGTIRCTLLSGESEGGRDNYVPFQDPRRALTWGNDWVTVGEEVLLASEIQHDSKRRSTKISVEPGTEQLCPKMTLQPCASIHGIEKIRIVVL